MKQGNLFELLYPEFKIDKKIRLIELFAGVGSQMKAMSFQDKDFDSVKDISNAQLYHQAGDSICVCVLVGLFSQLLGLNSTEQIEKYIETIKE